MTTSVKRQKAYLFGLHVPFCSIERVKILIFANPVFRASISEVFFGKIEVACFYCH